MFRNIGVHSPGRRHQIARQPVGGFPSKKAAREACQKVIAVYRERGNRREVLPLTAAETELLGPVFRRHPDPKVSNAEAWGVGARRSEGHVAETWGFGAWTGTEWRCFSYWTAIAGRFYAVPALRTEQYKDTRDLPPLPEGFHYDHEADGGTAHRDLVDDWLRVNGLTREELEDEYKAAKLSRRGDALGPWTGPAGRRWESRLASYRKYHLDHARLGAVPAEVNLTRPRTKKPWGICYDGPVYRGTREDHDKGCRRCAEISKTRRGVNRWASAGGRRVPAFGGPGVDQAKRPI